MKSVFICRAEFVKSSERTSHLPVANLPEFAFIGRSNVGKSSLINMLADTARMAKVSGTPGKTQLINHFLLELSKTGERKQRNCYLTDLPGYGYARVSQKRRAGWTKMTETYLKSRANLINTFVLIDIRLPMQRIDMDFCVWMAKNQLPFSFVFTKADKVGKSKVKGLINVWQGEFLSQFTEMPHFASTSAIECTGRDEILSQLYEWSAQDLSNLSSSAK